MIPFQPGHTFTNERQAESINSEKAFEFFFGRFKRFASFCTHPLEFLMKKALLIATLLAAVALTACGKKEEAPVVAPAPAAVEVAPAPADAAPADAAPADAAPVATDAAVTPTVAGAIEAAAGAAADAAAAGAADAAKAAADAAAEAAKAAAKPAQ